MSARSIWKGTLHVGSSKLPIKLFSAVQDQAVHFHVLEKSNKSRIKQQMVNPDSGDTVPKENIRKGYEVRKGTFVLLDESEIRMVEPKPSREVEALEFVPQKAIDAQLFERPYYLGPDGDARAYFAMVDALSRKRKHGVVHWTMRKKSYVGAVSVYEGYLAVNVLRPAEEVLSARDLVPTSGRDLTQNERRMAEQLISVLRGEFRPEDFKDDYRDRVKTFIKAKARGRKPRLAQVKTKRPTGSLMDQLSKSLKVMKKADEKKAA